MGHNVPGLRAEGDPLALLLRTLFLFSFLEAGQLTSSLHLMRADSLQQTSS